ncbi:MAG: LWR-salt protein [Haloferacaceae archaeon]
MEAAYVLTVRFRLEPAGVEADPREFETVVRRPADPPGEEGWLFFRDALWRGEVNDDAYARRLASDWLGVPALDVSFRELETDEEYRESLTDAVAADLDRFNADSATEALHKYLGSSIRVT